MSVSEQSMRTFIRAVCDRVNRDLLNTEVRLIGRNVIVRLGDRAVTIQGDEGEGMLEIITPERRSVQIRVPQPEQNIDTPALMAASVIVCELRAPGVYTERDLRAIVDFLSQAGRITERTKFAQELLQAVNGVVCDGFGQCRFNYGIELRWRPNGLIVLVTVGCAGHEDPSQNLNEPSVVEVPFDSAVCAPRIRNVVAGYKC
jgi:hypothetical protein